ncbi:MAG: SEC-C metal-binding domain-containing protein [Syntrophomonas sp.]
MSSLKIGRNDPCPCGSGKKYKKCCGRLGEQVDISPDPFTRYSQLLTAVKLKLDQYYEQRIKKLRRDLRGHYLRFTVNPVLPRENEAVFSEWLWFGARISDGPTLGEEYLNSNGEYMDTLLKDCLLTLNNSFPSIYEVQSFEYQYLNIRDIFLDTNHRILLKEPWDDQLNQNAPLFMGRLVKIQEDELFSGMVVSLNNKSGEEDFLVRHLNFLSSLHNEDKNSFLKDNEEIVYGLFDHASKQIMVNFDHMEAARLDKAQKERLSKAINEGSDWQCLHTTQGYRWHQLNEEVSGYVRLALGENDLIWSAEVLDDIEKMRSLLSQALPGLESVVIQNRFSDQPPNDEYFNHWFLLIRDREAEQWLRTPHLELDDKTPAELMEEDNGKQRLHEMLSRQLDTSPEGEALIDYLKARIG